MPKLLHARIEEKKEISCCTEERHKKKNADPQKGDEKRISAKGKLLPKLDYKTLSTQSPEDLAIKSLKIHKFKSILRQRMFKRFN
ncbi:hypothetical protein [Thiomicrorhabdus xiamenensis]|uniref:Uncharacterized protein n=1 Tax=Thiomicrorhabdus xiamenensis TaxID=2739063 RepID=A0A7D4SNK1_9GAMM|nr:hypothetical protein [Thiomicrorhabdus xiamenensis]QKI89581.1 hypothetical protein HQN79_08375 [Thiomicrorhabdus xiamenensis]